MNKRVKYPRTYHLPWSDGITRDDKIIEDLHAFHNKRVIVTEKLDGENTTCYGDYIHARSIDGRDHPSRDWIKQFWGQFKADIPKGWRICGENLYAKHSIQYIDLPTYFMGFSVWNESNQCLSWDESLEYFKMLGITPVPVLYDGAFNVETIKKLYRKDIYDFKEGYVVRLADQFDYKDFKKTVAKFVRKGHIQTDKHWMFGQELIKNLLK